MRIGINMLKCEFCNKLSSFIHEDEFNFFICPKCLKESKDRISTNFSNIWKYKINNYRLNKELL